MKTKFKEGDIIEIIDIHPKDIFYKYKEDHIGIRFKLVQYTNIIYNEGQFFDDWYSGGVDYISANHNYNLYASIKVKKVKVLNPKNKKK